MPRPKSVGLVIVNLRLRKKDVAEAKRQARALGVPYQHLIRAWVAAGAAGASVTPSR
jgi:predicted DNA binding CopG/RHH family protein